MTDKIMEQIQAIRERHYALAICRPCGEARPCDAIQLAQKLELAVKALEEASCDCGAESRGREHTEFCNWVDSQQALAAIAEVK